MIKIIFCETTLNITNIDRSLIHRIDFKPSIKRGDIITLLNNKIFFDEIIIIDGVFDQSRSITHKEILLALERGIKVTGLSSIGALRAAELHEFGMFGFGEIFNMYFRGEIDADDEVAVSFVNKNGKIYSTIPLINIRKTVEKNALDKEIFKKAKEIFYKERTWARLRKVLSKKQFKQIVTNYMDFKEKDVIEYLRTISKKSIKHPKIIKAPKSVFILNELIRYFNGGIIGFIKDNIYSKYNSSLAKKKRSNIAVYITRFLEIPEYYAGTIISALEELDKVTIYDHKIYLFNREIVKYLKITDKSSFLSFLKERRIRDESIEEIFSSLFKLYKLFLLNNYFKVS